MFKWCLCLVIVLGSAWRASGEEYVYVGPWKTSNRKLDGVMTCVITPVAREKWKGRFYGTWQGVDFDYSVDFVGPPRELHGTAVIDGANYAWKGRVSQQTFQAVFDGDRYLGSFELKRHHPPGSVAQRQPTPRAK